MAEKGIKKAICTDCAHPWAKFNTSQSDYGDRFKCECGSVHVVGEDPEARGEFIFHLAMGKGDINASPRVAGIWTLERTSDGPMVYVTCPRCGGINGDEASEVDSEGYMGGKELGTCIECECGYHFWPFLMGWKERKKRVRK